MLYPTGLAAERFRVPRSIQYDGNLASVVNEIASGNDRLWMPARAVRAAVDLPLDTLYRIEAIKQATGVAIAAYRGETASAADRAETLVRQVGNVAIHQPWDPNSRDASTPYYSYQTAKRLEARVPGPALIIPMCHGGFVAGALTYLYRQDQHPDDAIYPVRLSTIKQQDQAPYLSSDEIAMLQELAKGRTIVVVDEDTARGTTLATAVHAFRDMLRQETIGVVNEDRRSDADIEAMGQFWEKV